MRAHKAALFCVLFIVAACTPAATIPTPPPDFTPPPKNPTTVQECNWSKVRVEVMDKRKPPSVYSLNCLVLQALDPDTPAGTKSLLVAGNVNRSMLQQITKIKEQYPYFTFSVSGPLYKDLLGNYNANLNIDVLNNLISLPVSLEYDRGRWKLSRAITCTLVGMTQSNPRQARKLQLACLDSTVHPPTKQKKK